MLRIVAETIAGESTFRVIEQFLQARPQCGGDALHPGFVHQAHFDHVAQVFLMIQPAESGQPRRLRLKIDIAPDQKAFICEKSAKKRLSFLVISRLCDAHFAAEASGVLIVFLIGNKWASGGSFLWAEAPEGSLRRESGCNDAAVLCPAWAVDVAGESSWHDLDSTAARIDHSSRFEPGIGRIHGVDDPAALMTLSAFEGQPCQAASKSVV